MLPIINIIYKYKLNKKLSIINKIYNNNLNKKLSIINNIKLLFAI